MKRRDLLVCIIILILYIIMESLGITCPIRYVTGVSCAGCGMSRAWLSLLNGDFNSAFYYHPLFLLPIPAALLFVFRKRLSKNLFTIALGLICIAFLAVYIIRLIYSDGSIVSFSPSTGAIARFLRLLCDMLHII